jgi:hypothetical protein
VCKGCYCVAFCAAHTDGAAAAAHGGANDACGKYLLTLACFGLMSEQGGAALSVPADTVVPPPLRAMPRGWAAFFRLRS